MSFLKGGKFKPSGVETTTTTTTTTSEATRPTAKPSPFGKKKLGGLNKPATTIKEEPKELDLDNQVEELHAEEPKAPATKPKLGGKKKLGGLKATSPVPTKEEEDEIARQEDLIAEAALCGDDIGITEIEEPNEISIEDEPKEEEPVKKETKKETKVEEKPKKKSRKKVAAKETAETSNTATIIIPAVDESKRISIEEMDAVMRPIVAPTTELWEKEKEDVLAALDSIKVEQDMTMTQVKNALAELDNLKFEVLPKCHDAETLYDGTKKNFETVKALAISRGNASNAEARKAEGILACQNFVTPSGAVVDLNQYMLLIEERNKFYQKIVEGINFKKYSLVNYNTALKIEAKEL